MINKYMTNKFNFKESQFSLEIHLCSPDFRQLLRAYATKNADAARYEIAQRF